MNYVRGRKNKKGHYNYNGKDSEVNNIISNCFIFRLIEFIIEIILMIIIIPILAVLVIIVSKDELFELIKDTLKNLKLKIKRGF